MKSDPLPRVFDDQVRDFCINEKELPWDHQLYHRCQEAREGGVGWIELAMEF